MLSPELGSFVIVEYRGTHTAVVLKVAPPTCVVAVATSKDRDIQPRVRIPKNSIAAKVGRLSVDTFFYPNNVAVVSLEDVIDVYKRCPPNVRNEIAALAVEAPEATQAALRESTV